MKINNKSILIILTLGVFGIINTEMGVVGIMPLLAEHFGVSISKAGLFVSLFALAIAIAGPTMPLLLSGVKRKKMMIIVLSVFLVSNLIQAFTANFYLALIVRVIPAFLHPVYISLAFTVAAASVSEKEAPKAVSKVMVGVSAGMVLGVPVVSFVAGTFSLQSGMLVFAVVNALVLLATIFFVPSMDVKEKLTYGEQVSILKKPIIWISIIAVIFLNGSIFGVYSYLAEYLASVTQINENASSMILMFYGLANIVGNMIAGKGLSSSPIRFVSAFPPLLFIMYIVLYFTGHFTIPAIIIILIWGILAGVAANINQYWITSVTLKAPEFGNGLFLSATNLGTTIGTTICGFFISKMGVSYVLFGGIILIILSFWTIIIRIKKYKNESTLI